MQEPQVILVNDSDTAIGQMGKLQAHLEGHLHRAFSVLLFNDKGEILLQKRALTKYHSPGLWTNTCCSHPAPDETLLAAVHRRLWEELYLKSDVTHIGEFKYRTLLEGGMIEHEYDHVFVGIFTGELPPLNLEEVDALKWESWDFVCSDIFIKEEKYTYWFKEIVEKIKEKINKYLHENL